MDTSKEGKDMDGGSLAHAPPLVCMYGLTAEPLDRNPRTPRNARSSAFLPSVELL